MGGADKEVELQAGCREGALIHRLVLCARNHEAHGNEARKKLQEIRE